MCKDSYGGVRFQYTAGPSHAEQAVLQQHVSSAMFDMYPQPKCHIPVVGAVVAAFAAAVLMCP